MDSDRRLLDQYVQTHSQEAFGQLAARHVDWIHSAALRQVRDPHLAEDVTQAVLILLYQKARSISPAASIGGWLFQTMRYACRSALRAQRRRQVHEQRAAAMVSPVTQPSDVEADWQELVPHLDAAVGRLSAGDREAVLLRFYQRQGLTDVAAALSISEEGARKRIARAVGKLRAIFSRQQITLSAAALTAVLEAKTTATAPAHLSASATSGALATSPAASAKDVAQGTIRLMQTTRLKARAVALAAILVASAIPLALGLQTPHPSPAPQATTQTAATQPASAPVSSRIQTALANIRTLHAVSDGEELWLDRSANAVAMRTADATYVINGRSYGQRKAGQNVIGRSRGSEAGIDVVLHGLAQELAGFETNPTRDPGKDRVIDGAACEAFSLALPRGIRGTAWLNQAGLPTLAQVPVEGRTYEGRWQYDMPIDRAVFALDPAPNVQVVDTDRWFEQHFPLDAPVFRKESVGSTVAVHTVERLEDGNVLLVLSSRLTDSVRREAPPFLHQPFGLVTYCVEPTLYASHPATDSFQPYRLAVAHGDTWVVVWLVLVPPRQPDRPADAIELKAHMSTGYHHSAEWLRARGITSPEIFQLRLPLPRTQVAPRSVRQVADGIYTQAEQMHAPLFWFMLTRATRGANGTTWESVAPTDCTRDQYVQGLVENLPH